jgi:hypothetical protein
MGVFQVFNFDPYAPSNLGVDAVIPELVPPPLPMPTPPGKPMTTPTRHVFVTTA